MARKNGMSLHLEECEQEDYLVVTVTGVIDSFDELMEYTWTVRSRAAALGYEKVLLDQRAMSFDFELGEIYLMAQELEKQSISGVSTRWAVVCQQERLEWMECVELFMRNRSYEYRVFSNMESALGWFEKS